MVATMETPSSHQGIVRLEAKNSAALEPARLVTLMPTISEIMKNAMIKTQSIGWRDIEKET